MGKTKGQSLQVRQLRRVLERDYFEHLDMGDYKSHSRDEIEKAKFSRALAAMNFAVCGWVTPLEAAQAITDGSNDHGIDLIGYSPMQQMLYVIQAKTSDGSPGLTDVQKFLSGVRILLNGDLELLGPKVRTRQTEIEEILSNDTKVRAIFTHLGTQDLDDIVLREVEGFENDINSGGEIFALEFFDQKSNYNKRNKGTEDKKVESAIQFDSWCTSTRHQDEILGIVSANEIFNLVDEFGDKLFDRNIRSGLSDSEVNEHIIRTLEEAPEDFWKFNNGITITASKIVVDGKVKPSARNETFKLEGISIVNGAQTSTSIYKAAKNGNNIDDAFVTVRVISMEERGSSFQEAVTRNTNMQNRVGGREFVALDPRQQDFKEMLSDESIFYSFRQGEKPEGRDYKDTIYLDEATRALACFKDPKDAARVKNRISAYWENINSDLYKSVFAGIDGAVLYNAVCVYRWVGGQIAEIPAEKVKGYADQFEKTENRVQSVYEQAQEFFASILCRSLKSVGFNFSQLDLSVDEFLIEDKPVVHQFFDRVVENYFDINEHGYPLAFFKKVGKVEELAQLLPRIDLKSN